MWLQPFEKCLKKAEEIPKYHKVPKFWDTRNLSCNLHKIQTKRPNLRLFCHKILANREDTDHAAPLDAD